MDDLPTPNLPRCITFNTASHWPDADAIGLYKNTYISMDIRDITEKQAIPDFLIHDITYNGTGEGLGFVLSLFTSYSERSQCILDI